MFDELKTTVDNADNSVNKTDLTGLLEALLFAAGEPITLTAIADILAISPMEASELITTTAKLWAADKQRGVYIREINDTYSLVTKPIFKDKLRLLFEPEHLPNLTPAAYEVLAIIAYNQPTTKAQIEAVRGVNSDGLVHRLLENALIEPQGFLEAPGRPQLWGTTDKFLAEFGLNSIEALPPMELLMYSSLQDLEENLQNTAGAKMHQKQLTLDSILG